MKIEHLIVQRLYQSKQVTLQGIGTFRLDPAVVLPGENEKDKDFVMPENAFQFDYNLKAEEDEALIQFIVQHTRKILPLASADLDSYVMLAKQFLNIGKPLVIEGVGTIQKNQAGEYQFIPGNFVTPKIESAPKPFKDKVEETISFETPSANTTGNRKAMLIAVVIAILAAAAFGIYYVMKNNEPVTDTIDSTTSVASEVNDTTATLKDTSSLSESPLPDSNLVIKTSVPVISTATSTFKIVLKKYPTQSAIQKAYARLTTYGHKLEIIRIDSFNYQLAIPFNTPVSDTTRAKDSLRRFFGGKPFVRI